MGHYSLAAGEEHGQHVKTEEAIAGQSRLQDIDEATLGVNVPV